MLTRREWLLGWANLPAVCAEYRQIHGAEEVTVTDLLDTIAHDNSLRTLAGAVNVDYAPLKKHWQAVAPLLVELVELHSHAASGGGWRGIRGGIVGSARVILLAS